MAPLLQCRRKNVLPVRVDRVTLCVLVLNTDLFRFAVLGLELDAEELELKRELAIREREGRWRARQEELLFQKRMVSEWRQRETERRTGMARAKSNNFDGLAAT
jgi:hypothetical protein